MFHRLVRNERRGYVKKVIVFPISVIGILSILIGMLFVFKPFEHKKEETYSPFEITQFQNRAIEVISYLYGKEGTFLEATGTISHECVTILQKKSDSKEIVHTYLFHVKTEIIELQDDSSNFYIDFSA